MWTCIRTSVISDEDLQFVIHEIHTTFGGVLLKKMNFSKQIIKIAEIHHWEQFGRGYRQGIACSQPCRFPVRKIGVWLFFKQDKNNTLKLEEGDLSLETDDEFELDHDEIIEKLSGLSALNVWVWILKKFFQSSSRFIP